MIQLSTIKSFQNDASFEKNIKNEIAQLDATLLPLQEGLSEGGYALFDTFTVMIIRVLEGEKNVVIKAGIFYRGVISGCSCADDPSPTDETSEYCEVVFDINKLTGEGTVVLATE